MIEEIKTITQETIKDQPLPGQNIVPGGSSSGSSKQTYTPATIPDQPLPQPQEASRVKVGGKYIVDDLGLVSSENFQFEVINPADKVPNGAGYSTPVAVDGVSMNIVLARASRVLLMFSCLSNSSGGSDKSTVDIYINDVYLCTVGLNLFSGEQLAFNATRIANLEAGTSTFKIKIHAASGNGVSLVGMQMGYLVLGK